MKIVVLDGYVENPGDLSWDGFAALGELEVYDRTPPELVLERIGAAEAIITNEVPISREILAARPGIRYIGMLSTGYNIVDVQAARERGIPVCNIPVYGTAAVAQFTIALLLEICHRVDHHSQAVHAGRWESCPDWCFWDYPQIELLNKTMGVIGFGRIGQATARTARALGMNILAFDEHPNDSGRELAEYVGLDRLLAESDVIALHTPLFPSTRGMINKNSISRMKDGVIILNTARGALIVEQDLADALNSGKVYAAGLDVVIEEPITTANPLLSAKNCLLTPHMAWAPKESRQRLMNMAVENLRAFAAGSPVNVVNP